MTAPLAGVSQRRYGAGVAAYIVLLLTTQSVMGLGIDKFKELWGVETLEVVAYLIVAAGGAGVLWILGTVWARCSVAERAWIGVALVLYGVGTLSARAPQERLHYLGYGLLAMLLYVGFARRRATDTVAGMGSVLAPAAAVIMVGSLVGFADELLQIAWPRRYFDWVDVRMNVVAVALGLLVAVPVWAALSRDRPPV